MARQARLLIERAGNVCTFSCRLNRCICTWCGIGGPGLLPKAAVAHPFAAQRHEIGDQIFAKATAVIKEIGIRRHAGTGAELVRVHQVQPMPFGIAADAGIHEIRSLPAVADEHRAHGAVKGAGRSPHFFVGSSGSDVL